MTKQFSFKDGKIGGWKHVSPVQVIDIKNLMFDGNPIHHEGLMLVTNEYKTTKLPAYFLPYWDPKVKEEKMMEISEYQLKHSCCLKDVLSLSLFGKRSPVKKVVIVLSKEDDQEELLQFLPVNIKPRLCPMVEDIVIKEPKYAMDQLEDAPLVRQYVSFLGNQKSFKQEPTVRMFKKCLEANGSNMYTFLKMTIKFVEQDSLVIMLTDYVKNHKCSVEGCSNFTKDKCSICKTSKYCSVACQKKDFETHSQNDCEKLKKHYFNRVEAFNKLITDVIKEKLYSGAGIQSQTQTKKKSDILTLDLFCSRIKPWALSGYHDHIVAKTFLLGTIKFSGEKYSNIDISETTQILRPLLKYGSENFPQIERDMMSELTEINGRGFYFQQLVLMKKLYERGYLDVSKIESGEWFDDFMARDEKFREKFEDDDMGAIFSHMSLVSGIDVKSLMKKQK